jgi:hypothetical protein
MSLRGRLPGTWSSSQARSLSGAFESVQRVELPEPVVECSAAGAKRLGELYWRELERSTLGLVRARPTGGAPRLRLLGVGPALLCFGQPELRVSPSSVSCLYPIRGGLLTRAAAGSISFTQTGSYDVAVCSSISGFFPRLAGHSHRSRWNSLLYAQIQQRLHVALGRRFFARLCQEAGR